GWAGLGRAVRDARLCLWPESPATRTLCGAGESRGGLAHFAHRRAHHRGTLVLGTARGVRRTRCTWLATPRDRSTLRGLSPATREIAGVRRGALCTLRVSAP